jgi:hypothetical protein
MRPVKKSLSRGRYVADMTERRRATRQRSFLRGCICFNNRHSGADCLIRDISEGGARLIFSNIVNTPDVVDLHIPHKEQMLRAHVQWRRGDEVGVTFASELRDDGAPFEQDLARRVDRLEAEIAALRKILKRLKNEFTPGAEDAA